MNFIASWKENARKYFNATSAEHPESELPRVTPITDADIQFNLVGFNFKLESPSYDGTGSNFLLMVLANEVIADDRVMPFFTKLKSASCCVVGNRFAGNEFVRGFTKYNFKGFVTFSCKGQTFVSPLRYPTNSAVRNAINLVRPDYNDPWGNFEQSEITVHSISLIMSYPSDPSVSAIAEEYYAEGAIAAYSEPDTNGEIVSANIVVENEVNGDEGT